MPHLLHALVGSRLQLTVGAVQGLVQDVEDLVLPDRYVVAGRQRFCNNKVLGVLVSSREKRNPWSLL